MEFISAIAIAIAVVALLDAGFIEKSLKPLWRVAGYSPDAMKWYQLHLFGTWFIVCGLLGFSWLWLIKLVLLLISGFEDLLYALFVPLYNRDKKYVWNAETTDFLIWSFPKVWPWLGKHSGQWSWLSNWWLIGISYLLTKDAYAQIPLKAVIVSSITILIIILIL
jgi:hypothetical protein